MKASRSALLTTGASDTGPAPGPGESRTMSVPVLGDDALLSADSFELLQRLFDLLVGMRGHAARPEYGLPHVDRGVDRGVRIDALSKECLPEGHGLVLVAHRHRHDRRLGLADVKAEALEPLAPHGAKALQPVHDLWLALEDIESGQSGGG